MKYNIEKIYGIAEKLAEIVEEAIAEADQSEIKIGTVENSVAKELTRNRRKGVGVFF